MELVVFDLDGTLLDREPQTADHTGETLRLLIENDIAFSCFASDVRNSS